MSFSDNRVRTWFLTARGWRPILVAVLITALFLGLVLILQGGPAHAQRRQPADPDAAAYPASAPKFVKHFKDGAYDRSAAHPGYDAWVRHDYLHAYMRQWRRHHDTRAAAPPAPRTVRRAAWARLNDHDSCAGTDREVSTTNLFSCDGFDYQPTFWDALNIFSGSQPGKWSIRVLWCGGIGVLIFETGGTAAAAIGPGAAACLGGFFVQ